MLAETVTAVRRPEYTGRNRCWPCTALNLCLALGAAGLVARLSLAAVTAVPRRRTTTRSRPAVEGVSK